ncbi:MAG: hypothetical protein DDT22_00821 [candidate division WS2 bacterium]|nr:hypothetical protein [Candidatus Lithacetigena glycinireducens]MBT9175147.1 hypothetical protein [Candidatus Lithacetigena glycinireducens]
MNTISNVHKFINDIVFVFLSQVLVIRHRWFWTCFMVVFYPLAYAAFVFLLVGADKKMPLYIVTGSITTALTTSAMLTLGQRLGGLKDLRAFEFYASLPISKLAFIFGLITEGLISSLPSAIILLFIGMLLFGFSIHNILLFTVTIILAGYSLAGLGAVIGFRSRSGGIASIITQIINPIIIFLAPVYMPPEKFPYLLQKTSWFLPTTHVARLFRNSLEGTSAGNMESLIILLLFLVTSILVVEFGLDWRSERPLG